MLIKFLELFKKINRATSKEEKIINTEVETEETPDYQYFMTEY
jgi:hypothetical protein